MLYIKGDGSVMSCLYFQNYTIFRSINICIEYNIYDIHRDSIRWNTKTQNHVFYCTDSKDGRRWRRWSRAVYTNTSFTEQVTEKNIFENMPDAQDPTDSRWTDRLYHRLTTLNCTTCWRRTPCKHYDRNVLWCGTQIWQINNTIFKIYIQEFTVNKEMCLVKDFTSVVICIKRQGDRKTIHRINFCNLTIFMPG